MADEPAWSGARAEVRLTAADICLLITGWTSCYITDVTNYCDACARCPRQERTPGQEGYPGFMYSDLASLYERADAYAE